MSEELVITPTPLEIAESVQGQLTMSGGEGREGIPLGFDSANFNYSGSDYNANNTSRIITRISDGFNRPFGGIPFIPKEQGLTVEAMTGFGDISEHSSIGVYDFNGRFTGFNLSYIQGIGSKQAFLYYDGTVKGSVPYSDGNSFRVISDGISLQLYQKVGATYLLRYSNIMPNTTGFYWYFEIGLNGLSLYNVLVGSDSSFVPFTWQNVQWSISPSDNLETEIITPDKLGVTVFDNRSRILTADTDSNQHATVNINVSPLYLRPLPVGRQFAIQGEEVIFETNGGTSGEFEASIGTIVDTLKWLAPNVRDTAEFTYSIGNSSATTSLEVVPKLEIENVEDGYFTEILAQGETIQLVSNIPEVEWITLDHEGGGLVTPDGYFTAPTDAENEVFGEQEVPVKAIAFGQALTFIIKVYAMYPTPEFCGANAIKWVQIRKDYLPTVGTTSGGKREVKNKNKNGIVEWVIDYEKLRQKSECCVCGEDDCEATLGVAERLDAFYNRFTFNSGRKFAVIDKHTGELFKGVQMTKYENDHIRYPDGQIRGVELYYDGGEINLGSSSVDNLSTEIEDNCFEFRTTVLRPKWESVEW